ncbi:flocculation protein FLO11-like [Grus japonensis]|uniref:Flocculation protein FLO11-like n=1 Tax=Grus japonensis TaxID=30415 RepID=A0ABC9XW18_GRUJA
MNATVGMTAKVDNREFTDDLADKSSVTFKIFEEEFKKMMKEIYKEIEGYQDVVIHSLSRGSIVVNYTVLLTVRASITANETVEAISKNLVNAISNYTNCDENNSLCFNPAFNNVTSYEVQELDKSLCEKNIPEQFQSYYSPFITATTVICITRCDKRSTNPYPCVHGTCTVTRSGPQCECSEQSGFWYQDSACNLRVSKVGVTVGVLLVVLVVAIAVFTAFLVRARRQKEEYRDKLTSRSDLYCGEDENWTGSEGFTASNRAATWDGDRAGGVHIQRPSHVVIP